MWPRFSDRDDIDLIILLHIEPTRKMEENGIPDLDDAVATLDDLRLAPDRYEAAEDAEPAP